MIRKILGIVAGIAAAFVIIHLAWGLGGLTHLLTFGRWPPWRLPPSVQRA